MNEYKNDPNKLLSLLNGLFANAIGSTLKSNSTGLASILGGSGITLPSGILPSGVTIPTAIPSSISIPSFSIPSQLATLSISIPTAIPTNLISGLSGGIKARGDAQPEAELEVVPQPNAEELAKRDVILASIQDVHKRDILSDILGIASRFTNLTDLPSAEQLANKIIPQFAQQIGIYDFYDFHIQKYCLGKYYPTNMANATVSLSAIKRNVTECLSYSSLDLQASVQGLLNKTGFASQAGTTLDSIHFPADLTKYINLAKSLLKALTGLYAATIGLSFLVMLFSLFAIFGGRGREIGLGLWLWIASLLGWICAAVASIIVTVAGSLVGNEIKKLGGDLGLSYTIGKGFLGISWTTFGCLFIISFISCFVCCGGCRRRRKEKKLARSKPLNEKATMYS